MRKKHTHTKPLPFPSPQYRFLSLFSATVRLLFTEHGLIEIFWRQKKIVAFVEL